MLDSLNTFVTPAYLRSVWQAEYRAWIDSPAEAELIERLQRWAARPDLGETGAEPAFIHEFFHNTWGYVQAGQAGSGNGFTLRPRYNVPGAGAGGNTGKADAALGYFSGVNTGVPQVLCEYKGIRSALDAEQKRKGNTRSPVRQALDYLSHARKGMIGSEPQVPTWALVTNMNEFRLYWYDRGERQHVGFIITPKNLFDGPSLLAQTEAARFHRFLFVKLFHRETLLTPGGRSRLVSLIYDRRFQDRKIETAYYAEYRALRDRLYTELLARNGPGTSRFPGTKGRLVRAAQKILDRLLFIFFCEDMGQQLAFPPTLFRNLLVRESNDPAFDPAGTDIWQKIVRLFKAMNEGSAFGGYAIHKFNGGLFAADATLEGMDVPNGLFCQHFQGQNDASIAAHKQTVLYLCASYNYATDLGEGGTRAGQQSLGLYTLGRIFEQSITELEILEAQADERPSINEASQRKRDGVYYTPEWVVQQIVDFTLRPSLEALRHDAGWTVDEQPTLIALDRYREKLRTFTVLDPACGSGAFLITALRHLSAEWRLTALKRREVAPFGEAADEETEAALVARLLRDNIFGIDINPASVEIAQLALWLHTARGDQPLSSLDRTVVNGNTLVSPAYYRGVQLTINAETQERVAAFDWQVAFPAVAARGGFDAIVGNPPYVKLQNFRPASPDVAEYLQRGRPNGFRPFRSTQTGNFDLYLPFIEQGLAMLNAAGRLGYIAPSVWTVNEYGAGLRALVSAGRQLDRWLDFGSYQVFEEATTYTALQFFSKAPTEAICVAKAPGGVVPPDPWADAGQRLPWGQEDFGDRWLLLTGAERALIDRLSATCKRLDDPTITASIFVGIQTSADWVYHLERIAPGQYRCAPPGTPRPTPYVVEIEDAIMRPLISGAEAKRYQAPQTGTWLLFPYAAIDGRVRLIVAAMLQTNYPKAWAYLCSHKAVLELREATSLNGVITGPVYDDLWYRYVYPKGLDRQHLAKLVVPRLVSKLACSVDDSGTFCLDNVDVGGVLPPQGQDLWYLAAILNAPVADWVFGHVSKPFRGDYRSANKQFIAPLPIPSANDQQREAVIGGAQSLQRLHTERRDLLDRIARRLNTVRTRARPEHWLFAGLVSAASREADAPVGMTAAERRAWAKAIYDTELKSRHETLGGALRPGIELNADCIDGELRLLVNGAAVLDRIFVQPAEDAFLLAQWKVLASTLTITERLNGKTLSKKLRTLAVPENSAVVEQVVSSTAQLTTCEADIAVAETALNTIIYDLYGLTVQERALVKSG